MRDSKVCKDGGGAPDEHILWFNVTMCDSALMRELQRFCNLVEIGEQRFGVRVSFVDDASK